MICRAAAEVLAIADEELPFSNSTALQAARLGLAHDRALHRRDVRHAARLAAELVGLADPADAVCQRLRCATNLSSEMSILCIIIL